MFLSYKKYSVKEFCFQNSIKRKFLEKFTAAQGDHKADESPDN